MGGFGGFGNLDGVVRAEAARAKAQDMMRQAEAAGRRHRLPKEPKQGGPGILRRLAGKLVRRSGTRQQGS